MRISTRLSARRSGVMDARLFAAAFALEQVKTQEKAKLRVRKATIDHGRDPGEGVTKRQRRRVNGFRQRKYDVTKQLQHEPFTISSLILDLDGEGCPGVRPYGFKLGDRGGWVTRRDSGDQRKIWNYNPILDGLVKRMGDFPHELRESEERWMAPAALFDPRRISRRDLLEVAFLGARQEEPREAEQPAKASMPGLLWSNGISDRLCGDETRALSFMLGWRRLHPPHDQRYNGALVTPQVVPWPGLTLFRRSLASLFESEADQEYLSFWKGVCQDSDHQESPSPIQHIIDGLRTEDASEALSFLNNTAINLSSRQSSLPTPLANLGIELAFETGNLAAIPRFFDGDGSTSLLTLELGQRMLQSAETTPTNKLQLFAILTGQQLSRTIPYGLSIRSTIKEANSQPCYGMYISLLGQLGTIRALWHEWHGIEGLYSPNNSNEEASRAFTDGLLRYRDSQRALQQPRGLTSHGAGVYAEDLYLDARDMARSVSTPADEPYVPEAEPGEEERFREECIRALRTPRMAVARDALMGLLLG